MAGDELTLASNAITDIETVSEYLKIDPSDGDLLGFLTTWINLMSSSIEEHIAGPVKKQALEEILDGSGMPVLYTLHTPVNSVWTPEDPLTDLTRCVMYRDDPTQAWQELEDTLSKVIIRKDRPYLVRLWDKSFPMGMQNIKLNLYFGYDPIPGPIQQVCVEKVAEVYQESRHGQMRLGQTQAVMSMSSQQATNQYISLAEKHKALLAPYVVSPYRMQPWTREYDDYGL
jgi:hypothetical protein